jgi:hypothetical protein
MFLTRNSTPFLELHALRYPPPGAGTSDGKSQPIGKDGVVVVTGGGDGEALVVLTEPPPPPHPPTQEARRKIVVSETRIEFADLSSSLPDDPTPPMS